MQYHEIMTTFAVVHGAHDHSWASFYLNIFHIDMKRLFAIILCLISIASAIMADEKVDSLKYYRKQADTAILKNKKDKASSYYAKTLRLYKEIYRDVSEDTAYAEIASIYANLCYQSGNYKEAIKAGTEASNIYKIKGAYNLRFATVLNNLANCYTYLGNYNKAIQPGIDATDIFKEVLGNNHPDYASSLNDLASFYSNIDKFDKAIQLVTKAIEIQKNVLGIDNPEYAKSLSNLAWFNFCLGKTDEAIQLETEALRIRRKKLGTNNQDYAKSLNNLADYNSWLGHYDEAISLATEAIKIRKQVLGTEHPDYAKSLNTLALLSFRQGEYNEAVRMEKDAIEIQERVIGTEHPDYAISLNDLSLFYSNLCDYKEAIRLTKEALKIREKVLGTESAAYALSLNSLGSCYALLNNYEEAFQLEIEALKIFKKVIGTKHLYYTATLTNIADCFIKKGDYKNAYWCAYEAKEICKEVLGEKHPHYAMSLSFLAHCNYLWGFDSEAVNIATTAANIFKESLGPEHPYYATALNNLTMYNTVLCNYDDIVRQQTEVMNIYKKSLGSQSPIYATSILNLAYYNTKIENYTETISLLNEYLSIIHKNVLNTFSILTSNERQMYWSTYSTVLNQWIPQSIVNTEMPEIASILYDNTALFAKGLLLSTELEMTKLVQESGDSEALQMLSSLKENRQILNTLYSKPIKQRHINCDSLERISTELERQLMSRIKEFGDFSRNLGITWRDVQNRLNDDDIAIEFLSYLDKNNNTVYIALTLCKNDTAPELTHLFTLFNLDQYSYTASSIQEMNQASLTDRIVWGPLSARLEGKKHVYFSPSGTLHNINIEYYSSMEGKNCHRLSSTRELVIRKPSPTISSATTATIFGGIEYGAAYDSIITSAPQYVKDYIAMNAESSRHCGHSDYRSILRYGVNPLPGSHAELKEISTMLRKLHANCDTLSGIQASEESFKALSGQRKSLLHISTHGFYYTPEETDNLNDHLQRMLIGNDRPTQYEDQSLLRCWLCFAGANLAICDTIPEESRPTTGQDDGILNALEIAQTDLRGLDLVVLSACQTALGDVVQGEGVFGLQRGFKKAGAQSILMSLWEVDDEVTHILMTEFYRGWTDGMTKTQALRKAQAIVKQKYPDPHDWAAFILLDALD